MKEGEDLVSYTDSTIIFKGPVNSTWFNALKDSLSVFCNKYSPKVFFSLSMTLHNKSNVSLIVRSGDKELNAGFQNVVAQAKAELKPSS